MTDYKFPIDLQVRFEGEIVTGVLSKGSTVSFEDLQQHYQANADDLDRVIKSSLRKGLLKQAKRINNYSVLGKSQPTIISVFQHAAKTGLAPKSIVRTVTVIPASEFIAQKLNIKPDDPIFQQTRTRLVNGEIIANQNNYIPIEVCPGLETVDLSHTSFQSVLEGQFNAVVADIKETFAISPASAEDAEIFGIEQESDTLIVQRLSLSPSGLPLVWADIHVLPERYHYVKDLWPDAEVFFEQRKGSL